MLALFSTFLSASGFCSGIYIVRHGEGEQNVLKFFNSNPKNKNYREVHLTEAGKEQAASTARKLASQGLSGKNISAVYVSPLPRAKETAGILSQILGVASAKIKETDAVIETDFGKYEGTKYSDFPWDIYDHSHASEYGGETYGDVQKRVRVFMDKLLRRCDRNANILIVTHGEPATAIGEYITGVKKDMIKTGESVEFSWDTVYSGPTALLCKGKLR